MIADESHADGVLDRSDERIALDVVSIHEDGPIPSRAALLPRRPYAPSRRFPRVRARSVRADGRSAFENARADTGTREHRWRRAARTPRRRPTRTTARLRRALAPLPPRWARPAPARQARRNAIARTAEPHPSRGRRKRPSSHARCGLPPRNAPRPRAAADAGERVTPLPASFRTTRLRYRQGAGRRGWRPARP